jgi:hypothetical protein
VLHTPRSGVTKKTYRERKSGDSVGDRRAGGCAASREMRITCVAFGIRNHLRERIADRHCAYLPGFGAVEEPEDFTVTVTVTEYRFTVIERPLAI